MAGNGVEDPEADCEEEGFCRLVFKDPEEED